MEGYLPKEAAESASQPASAFACPLISRLSDVVGGTLSCSSKCRGIYLSFLLFPIFSTFMKLAPEKFKSYKLVAFW